MLIDAVCELSYARFHLLWTLPPIALLFVLARPFLTELDRLKLVLLPLVAFVWTTAWDSELIRMRAWGYPRACVLATVWRIPVEEYFFFLIQSVMTTLLTTLLTRWMLPPLHLASAGSHSSVFRPGVLVPAANVVICLSGLKLAFSSGNLHTYYLGMILWWSSIPLILLNWGSADYIAAIGSPTLLEARAGKMGPAVRRTMALLASVALPTLYLWAADVFALRRGTWFISRHTSLEVFIVPDLPIEEATFFFVTNLILVVASFAFDRCVAVARFYPQLSSVKATDKHTTAPLSPVRLPLTVSSVATMWRAFLTRVESDTSSSSLQGPTDDAPGALAAHLAILSSASRSFSLASLLLPWDLRADLGSVYAFCRKSDDLIDHAGPAHNGREEDKSEADGVTLAARKERRLQLLRQLVLLACGEVGEESKGGLSTSTMTMSPEQRKQLIALRVQSFARAERLPENGKGENGLSSAYGASDWEGPEDPLKDVGVAASILVDMRELIPRELWIELLDGYAIDLGMDAASGSGAGGDMPVAAQMETLDHLGEYAQCVAGAVGEMCVRVVLARVGRPVARPTSASQRETLTDMLLAIGRHPSRTLSKDERRKVVEREAALSEEEDLLLKARRMGVALQLINIARDVVSDARVLRRTYLPRELFAERDAWVFDALRAGSIEAQPAEAGHHRRGSSRGSDSTASPPPASSSSASSSTTSSPAPSSVRIEREVSPALIQAYQRKLLGLAQALYDSSFPTLARLPCPPARAGLRVACAVYADIASAVLAQGEDAVRLGTRARSGAVRRVLVALKALYRP